MSALNAIGFKAILGDRNRVVYCIWHISHGKCVEICKINMGLFNLDGHLHRSFMILIIVMCVLYVLSTQTPNITGVSRFYAGDVTITMWS